MPTISSETRICEECKVEMSETKFHKYVLKSTGEVRRLKRCNDCRSANPKRGTIGCVHRKNCKC